MPNIFHPYKVISKNGRFRNYTRSLCDVINSVTSINGETGREKLAWQITKRYCAHNSAPIYRTQSDAAAIMPQIAATITKMS